MSQMKIDGYDAIRIVQFHPYVNVTVEFTDKCIFNINAPSYSSVSIGFHLRSSAAKGLGLFCVFYLLNDQTHAFHLFRLFQPHHLKQGGSQVA